MRGFGGFLQRISAKARKRSNGLGLPGAWPIRRCNGKYRRIIGQIGRIADGAEGMPWFASEAGKPCGMRGRAGKEARQQLQALVAGNLCLILQITDPRHQELLLGVLDKCCAILLDRLLVGFFGWKFPLIEDIDEK